MVLEFLLEEDSEMLLEEGGQALVGVDAVVWFLRSDGAELGVGAGEHDVEELEVVEAAVEVDVEELHQVVALALGSVGSVVAQEVQDID